MGYNVCRFLALYSFLMLLSLSNLFSQGKLDNTFTTELDRLQFNNEREDNAKKKEKTYALLNKAYAHYKIEEYQESLKLLKKAIKLNKDNQQLPELYNSIKRMYDLQNAEKDALNQPKKPKKEERMDVAKVQKTGKDSLDWRIVSDTLLDPNKYLFSFEFNNTFNTIKYQDEKNDRFGLGGSADFFFPQKDRAYGIYIGMLSHYVDLSNAKFSDDYTIWQYSTAFQWRLSSTFPNVKEKLHFILRFGMMGQQVLASSSSNLDANLYSYDVIPWFEASIQDAFFYHNWPSKFTKNLIFKPVLGIAWWPFGSNSNGLVYFGLSMGYRIGYFIVSMGYNYRYQVAEGFQDMSFSELSLKFTLQYY